jgi:hypothetical protein
MDYYVNNAWRVHPAMTEILARLHIIFYDCRRWRTGDPLVICRIGNKQPTSSRYFTFIEDNNRGDDHVVYHYRRWMQPRCHPNGVYTAADLVRDLRDTCNSEDVKEVLFFVMECLCRDSAKYPGCTVTVERFEGPDDDTGSTVAHAFLEIPEDREAGLQGPHFDHNVTVQVRMMHSWRLAVSMPAAFGRDYNV